MNRLLIFLATVSGCLMAADGIADTAANTGTGLVLGTERLRDYVDAFNRDDDQSYIQTVPNDQAFDFLVANVPRFDCPDANFERTWYFRWWTFRKHLKKTPDGWIVTEFLPPVSWAGKHNAIVCPAAHHFNEGRWLQDPRYLKDYAVFWLRKGGDVRAYTFWPAEAFWQYHLVHPNEELLIDLLPDLVADYRAWDESHRDKDRLFWQSDTRDGGEVSVGGHGKRPTINSAMFGEAATIARIARLAGEPALAERFETDAAQIRNLVQTRLWNPKTKFFHTIPFPVQHRIRPSQPEVDPAARELIGYVPWYFHLPEPKQGYEVAWGQVTDPQGFFAPYGLTTAEQRHRLFRVRYDGHPCQWCGPVWPFSTSITLKAMANVLHDYPQNTITARDYFEQLNLYTRCHQLTRNDGRIVPWIDENLDPFTGTWIARERLKELAIDPENRRRHGPADRGKDYNHSTYCDLIVSGLVGLIPREDDVVEVAPLLPENTWPWFCLDQLPYHGRRLTILWDESGRRYGRGPGLRILVDGQEIAATERLERVEAALPNPVDAK